MGLIYSHKVHLKFIHPLTAQVEASRCNQRSPHSLKEYTRPYGHPFRYGLQSYPVIKDQLPSSWRHNNFLNLCYTCELFIDLFIQIHCFNYAKFLLRSNSFKILGHIRSKLLCLNPMIITPTGVFTCHCKHQWFILFTVT